MNDVFAQAGSDGLLGTTDDNVNAMADILVEDFQMPGLTLTRRPGGEVGDHLDWTTPAWHSRPDSRCVLIGHHDTVFPVGTFEKWQIDGDILTGPGVLDMKGGLLIVRTALAALSGGVWLRNWAIRRRKDRIDVYVDRVLAVQRDLAGADPPPAEALEARLRATREEALRLLIDEKVDANAAFEIFLALCDATLREIAARRP